MSAETAKKGPKTPEEIEEIQKPEKGKNYYTPGGGMIAIVGMQGSGHEAKVAYIDSPDGQSTDTDPRVVTESGFRKYIEARHAMGVGVIEWGRDFVIDWERSEDQTDLDAEAPQETVDQSVDLALSQEEVERMLTESDAKYRDLLKQYGELSADNDTKSPLLRKMLGGRKRERMLEELYDDLAAAKSTYAVNFVRFCATKGMYEGDGARTKQQMSDDIFDTIREIDPDTRKQTNEVLFEREGEQNLYQKAATQIGRFLNWGDKSLDRYAKNTAAGLGIGVAKGFLLAIFHGSFPVSVTIAGAVMTAASATARYGSTLKYQADALRTHTDEDGKAVPRLSNEQFEALRDSIKLEGIEDVEQMGTRLARDILRGTREAGLAENKAARRQASKNMAGVSVGMALGGLMGGFGGRAIHDAWTAMHQHARTPGVVMTGAPEKAYIPSVTPSPTGSPPEILPSAVTPKSTDLLANNFVVEHGSTFTQEWQQWASANGHQIDAETAGKLNAALLKKFGSKGMIYLDAVADPSKATYSVNGDVRIAMPGDAHWQTGVAEFAQQWLAQQGKW